MREFDLVVIGAGQGGVPLAIGRAEAGDRVALIERGPVGGSCVNHGCTPSKTLLASAHAAGRARAASKIGVNARVDADFPAVMRRVRQVRTQWREGVEKSLAESPVELVRAEAHFVGQREIEARGERFRASRVVIDTGSSPNLPPIEGLDDAQPLTDLNIFDLESLPRTLLVLGGGYIGLELGQALQRLGSSVTIIDHNARPLSKDEPDVGEALRAALEEDGVSFRLGAKATSVQRRDGRTRLVFDNGETLTGDALLVAVGRTPNTNALRLDAAGVETDDKGGIRVNDRLETNIEGVYAIGDVAGQPQFTHVSWEDHRRLLTNWSNDAEPRTRDDRALASAVFTDPQVARVGLTESQARDKGIDAESQTKAIKDTARGAEWGLEHGFLRLVAEKHTHRILGATIVGYEAAEVIHTILAHIERGSTMRDLADSVHIHPTLAENLPSLARQFL